MKILLPLILLLSFTKLNYRNTPNFGLPEGDDRYLEATKIIIRHGNHDDFYKFMKTKRKYFAHTVGTVDDNISKFRDDLAKFDFIPIEMITHKRRDFIGGWQGMSIKMNLNYVQDDIGKASILMHEVAHKYGWRHLGDERFVNDNLNSFPYAVGIDFEDYLRSMEAEKLKAKRKP